MPLELFISFLSFPQVRACNNKQRTGGESAKPRNDDGRNHNDAAACDVLFCLKWVILASAKNLTFRRLGDCC